MKIGNRVLKIYTPLSLGELSEFKTAMPKGFYAQAPIRVSEGMTLQCGDETTDGIRQIHVTGEDLSDQGHIFAIIGEASKASMALEGLPSRASVHKHSLLNVSSSALTISADDVPIMTSPAGSLGWAGQPVTERCSASGCKAWLSVSLSL